MTNFNNGITRSLFGILLIFHWFVMNRKWTNLLTQISIILLFSILKLDWIESFSLIMIIISLFQCQLRRILWNTQHSDERGMLWLTINKLECIEYNYQYLFGAANDSWRAMRHTGKSNGRRMITARRNRCRVVWNRNSFEYIRFLSFLSHFP